MTGIRAVPRSGPLAAPYWEALRKHGFALPRDGATGRFVLPIHAADAERTWEPAPRTGTVESFSWVHVPAEGYVDDVPYVVATVSLDDGPQLMANIVGATENDVWIGSRVRLVFEERPGGWVVPQFTPDDGEGDGRLIETPTGLGYPSGAWFVTTEGVDSIPAAFQRTVGRFPDAVALRTIDDSVRLTWRQTAEKVESFARGLAALGVRPSATVALLLSNRAEHIIADLAVVHLGATATSVYNSLPPADIALIVADAGADVMVTERAFLDSVMSAIEDHALDLKHLVVVDGDLPRSERVRIHSVADIESTPSSEDFDFDAGWRAVGPDDIGLVVYTAGSTGHPKGVELHHLSLLLSTEAYDVLAPLSPGRRLLCAFPLAHMAERVCSYYTAILQGHCVTFCPDIRQLDHYYMTLRPAYVFVTPRSLQRFRSRIERHIALEADQASRAEMERAVRAGIEVSRAEQEDREIDNALRVEHDTLADARSGLLASVGLDQVEFALVGSAPVPPDLLTYFWGLGLPLREGYGMSELGAGAAAGRLDVKPRAGYTGPPASGLELRLADDGEILARGPRLMKGYRNHPELTRECYDEDGWFHTGDVGVFSDEGFLRIIDRKKEIIINANGKNMSPVNIEAKVSAAGSLIGHVVAVGDGRPHIAALLTIDPEGFETFCRRHDLDPGLSLADLADDPRLRGEIQAQIDRANAEMSEVETVRAWQLLTNQWVPGGDELTPTMKLKRRSVTSKYAETIAHLYS